MRSERILPGTVIGDRFEIERLANAGGMGDVFRAIDRQTGAPVAVKFVRNSDEAFAARFEREAQALAQCEHPGIVRYVAHGSAPAVFLAMEWLEGEDLSRRLARGTLSITDTLLLAKTVVDALATAHTRGIVHRDIKPSNIFLCGDRLDSAKLLDFGVAHVAHSTRAITGTGQLVGTLGYMAPEQALSGRNVTAAVDVFSLGCVLFECMAGRLPFAGEWPEVLSKILLNEPPRLRELRRDAPHAVDELISRMMRKDPASRPSLASIAADLATFLTAGKALGEGDLHSDPSIPAVTGDERRLVAVIAADCRLAPEREEGALGASADTVPSSRVGIGHVVGKFGGDLEILPDGAPLVTLSSAGAATDLATRAARCALAVRDLLADARIAVASGRGDPTQTTVVSDVIARARDLLGRAGDSKHVRIDETTAGLLDSTFAVGGDGSALVLIGQREQSSVRKLLGKSTPCVGRERELSMLSDLVAECIDEPLSTALLITGNAGVGKSRLRHELVRALRDREELPDVWMARGDPIAAGAPFGLLAQLLRAMAGLVEGELVEVRRQKLLARVGRNLPIHDAMRVAQFLGELVRAEFSGEQRPALRAARQDRALMADQLRTAWDDLVAAETAAGPLVIVLEDLQWGDLPSIRFIDSALRNQRHRPLLVLSLARPEVHDVFPGLFRDRRVNEVRLTELTPSASRRLALDVLGPDVDPKVLDALVEKSHGNAFYLEELIRSVAEGSSALPETVLAMAQARLERLEPGARRLLRAASVFGTTFWASGVAALTGADAPADVRSTLEDLVHREVIVQNPSSRFRGDREYAFRHLLVRDAAYEMLTERDRTEAHRRAAEWLEANGERDALVIAEHLERAGEKQRAVVWYLWASEQALEGNDLTSVLARAERGIQCGASGAVLGELFLLKAEASGWAGDPRHFALARSALELLPRGSAAWARAGTELAVASRAKGDHERLRATAESLTAVTLLEMVTVGHAWASARTIVELLEGGQSDVAERLVPWITAATMQADESDVPTLRAILDWLGAATALFARGTPETLLSRAGDITRAFERAGNARYTAVVALHAAVASAAVGDFRSGVTWAERAEDAARRLGLRSYEIRARAWLSFHLARSGHVDAALTTARTAVRDAERDRVAEGDSRVLLAQVLLAGGDAGSAYDEAEQVWREPDFSADARGRAGGLVARLLLDRGQAEEARAIADQTLALLSRVRPLGDADVLRTRDEAHAATTK